MVYELVLVDMFESLKRWFQSKQRVKNWRTAATQFHETHKSCEFCGITSNLEAHDVFPYHCVRNATGKTVEWWLSNFIMLCHQDHRQQAHCGDPDCLAYLPVIPSLAQTVTNERHEYATRC